MSGTERAPVVSSVTTVPEIRMPAVMAGREYRRRMPKTNAAAQPVQAPVTGRGIATKGINAIAPYFSYLASIFLRVLANSHAKNRSKRLECRRRNSETGPSKRRSGSTGTMFPMTPRRKALGGGIPWTLIAKGIAPRSSKTGRVAMSTTVSSGGRLSSRAIDSAVIPGYTV